jgi:hypothetical protein
MKIKKTYNEFIKENSEFIDEKTMREIFIDLIDMDFTFEVISGSDTRWYIDLKKTVDSQYDYIENDFSYGVTNFNPIKLDMNKVLDALDESKHKLNSMEYTVGYEIEFHFNDRTQLFISCHIQHNDTIDDDNNSEHGLVRW